MIQYINNKDKFNVIISIIKVGVDNEELNDEEKNIVSFLKNLLKISRDSIYGYEDGNKKITLLSYLGEFIFDLDLYDDNICQEMVESMLDTLKYMDDIEYTGNRNNRFHEKEYILNCNLPFLKNRVEWSYTLKNNWLRNDIIFTDTYGMIYSNVHIDEIIFEGPTFRYFVKAILEFSSVKNRILEEVDTDKAPSAQKRRM